MNKFFLFFLILIYSCSLNSESSFWTKTKKTELDKSFTKTLFQDIEPNKNEFNPKLKIKIPNIVKNILNYNLNNDGFTPNYLEKKLLFKSGKKK